MKKIYLLLLVVLSSTGYAQSDFSYGENGVNTNEKNKKTTHNLAKGNCDQTCYFADDLTNGSYFYSFPPGTPPRLMAVDIDVEEGTLLTLNQISVTVGMYEVPQDFRFYFYADNGGVPGELIASVEDATVVSMDSVYFVQVEVGTIRNVLLDLPEPLELSSEVATKYWMELKTDARAWSTSPNASDVIGLGFLWKLNEDDEEWIHLLGDTELMYSIDADCSELGTNSAKDVDYGYLISVYPNPGNGEIFIASNTQDRAISANVYSITGQKVFQSRLMNQQLDLSALNSGVYLLEVTTQMGHQVLKRVAIQ